MPSKPSRRAVLKSGLVNVAALAVPGLAMAQTPEPPNRIAEVESGLAKPLSEEARKLLEASLKQVASNSKSRKDTKLPENSEPYMEFRALPAGAKTR